MQNEQSARATGVGRSAFRSAVGRLPVVLLAIVSVCLLASALAKTFPMDRFSIKHASPFGKLDVPVAALEAVLSVSLWLPRYRLQIIRITSLFLAVAGCVAATRALVAIPTRCGCFGGWIELGPWTQIAVIGVLLAALGVAAPLTTSSRRTDLK